MVADTILSYFQTLELPDIPEGVDALLPFQDPKVFRLMQWFYRKYYSDNNLRIALFGINPGRLGSGQTGIGFTDPYCLKEHCGIKHHLSLEKELSATFIYRVIDAMGGASDFFSKFYITAVSPVGFLQEGKNLNYYDEPQLQKKLEPWIIQQLRQQSKQPFIQKEVVCIGRGKNLQFLEKVNYEMSLFQRIHVLPHPRWVLQYRRKQADDYVANYVTTLSTLYHRMKSEA